MLVFNLLLKITLCQHVFYVGLFCLINKKSPCDPWPGAVCVVTTSSVIYCKKQLFFSDAVELCAQMINTKTEIYYLVFHAF